MCAHPAGDQAARPGGPLLRVHPLPHLPADREGGGRARWWGDRGGGGGGWVAVTLRAGCGGWVCTGCTPCPAFSKCTTGLHTLPALRPHSCHTAGLRLLDRQGWAWGEAPARRAGIATGLTEGLRTQAHSCPDFGAACDLTLGQILCAQARRRQLAMRRTRTRTMSLMRRVEMRTARRRVGCCSWPNPLCCLSARPTGRQAVCSYSTPHPCWYRVGEWPNGCSHPLAPCHASEPSARSAKRRVGHAERPRAAGWTLPCSTPCYGLSAVMIVSVVS